MTSCFLLSLHILTVLFLSDGEAKIMAVKASV